MARAARGALVAALFVTASCAGKEGPIVGVPGDSVRLVAEIPVPAAYGEHDQFVRAGLAFLCSWNTGLQIYDVGDGRAGGSPSNPVKIGSVVPNVNNVSGGAQVHNAWWYWAPNGQKRYVFVGQEGPAVGGIGVGSSGDIHVVDVSNMAAPVEVAFYHMNGLGAPHDSAGVHNFWVDETNEILYAAYYNGGVVALNISGTLSGSLSAREIDRIQPSITGNYVWGVQLSGASLYASDMLNGIYQLKLTGSAFSVVSGGGNVPERFGSDLWVAGSYLYSGTWGSRAGVQGNAVKIWHLAASGAPTLVDSIITPGISTVSDIEVSADNRMLMFSGENGSAAGLYFYSLVGSPAHPVFLKYWPVTSNGNAGVHTATFYEAGGRRYVFAAKDPAGPSAMILDVTAINP